MIADAYGKYIGHLYSENDYNIKSDVKLLSGKVNSEILDTSLFIDERGYYAKSFIDEEPFIEFKNGSWIKTKR